MNGNECSGSSDTVEKRGCIGQGNVDVVPFDKRATDVLIALYKYLAE